MRLTHSTRRTVPTLATRIVPALAIALAAAFLSMPGAQAEPAVTVESVEAALHEAEAMNEQVNQLGEDVKKTSKQIEDLTAEIEAQTGAYEQQREALGATIVQQQMDSPLGTTASLLGSGDPEAFIEGLGAVQALNASRADALDAFTQISAELENRKAQLADRRASLTADQEEAAKKQAEIKAKYTKAKAELARLTAAQQATFSTSNVTVDFEIPAGGRAKAAIDFALAQLGDPYVYGGTGPNGWDCSGLVMKAYAAAGVSLPRVVGPQLSAVRRVSMSELRPGDIVAYGDMSHNGIYLGSGRVVHAPYPGKSVEITGLGRFSVAGRVG